jgi:hypothetical protein
VLQLETRRSPRPTLVRPSTVACGLFLAVAAVTYSSWVLEFVLPTGLNATESFLSELEGYGRPFRYVFIAGDKIAGVSAIAAAVFGWIAHAHHRDKLVSAGWIALGVFGLWTIADADSPVGCLARPGTHCPTPYHGMFAQLHNVHALTSTVAVNAIFLAMFTLTFVSGRRNWTAVRIPGAIVLAVTSLATAWMLIADNLPHDFALGWAQRVQVAGMSLWLLTLAYSVSRQKSSDLP